MADAKRVGFGHADRHVRSLSFDIREAQPIHQRRTRYHAIRRAFSPPIRIIALMICAPAVLSAVLGEARSSGPSNTDESPMRLGPNTPREAFVLPKAGGSLNFVSGGEHPILAACFDQACSYQLWDLQQGKSLAELRTEPNRTIHSVAVSPDGKVIAAGGGDETRNLRAFAIHLWDARTGKHLSLLAGYDQPVTGLAFSPDGKQLASVDHVGILRLWDVVTGSLVRKWESDCGDFIAFSPKGDLLATRDLHAADLWDPKTCKQVRSLQLQEAVLMRDSIAFSPRASVIATRGVVETFRGQGDSPITLWEAASGRKLGVLRGNGLVAEGKMAFRNDGCCLACAGDQEVRIWDVAEHRLLYRMPQTGHVIDLAFSPDGRWLAAATWQPEGGKRSVTVWELAP